jgi:hypothetical protein
VARCVSRLPTSRCVLLGRRFQPGSPRQITACRYLVYYESPQAEVAKGCIILVDGEYSVTHPKNERRGHPFCLRIDVKPGSTGAQQKAKWVLACGDEAELDVWMSLLGEAGAALTDQIAVSKLYATRAADSPNHATQAERGAAAFAPHPPPPPRRRRRATACARVWRRTMLTPGWWCTLFVLAGGGGGACVHRRTDAPSGGWLWKAGKLNPSFRKRWMLLLPPCVDVGPAVAAGSAGSVAHLAGLQGAPGQQEGGAYDDAAAAAAYDGGSTGGSGGRADAAEAAATLLLDRYLVYYEKRGSKKARGVLALPHEGYVLQVLDTASLGAKVSATLPMHSKLGLRIEVTGGPHAGQHLTLVAGSEEEFFAWELTLRGGSQTQSIGPKFKHTRHVSKSALPPRGPGQQQQQQQPPRDAATIAAAVGTPPTGGGGGGVRLATAAQQEELVRLGRLVARPFEAADDPEAERLLRRFWAAAHRGEASAPPPFPADGGGGGAGELRYAGGANGHRHRSAEWKRFGFQRDDPVSDLRAAGW